MLTSVTLAPRGLVGQGVALLARRAVAHEAHRVDRLAGAAGRHHDVQAGEVAAGAERGLDTGHDGVRRGEAALARVAPGRRPSSGPTMWTPRRASVAMLSCTAG